MTRPSLHQRMDRTNQNSPGCRCERGLAAIPSFLLSKSRGWADGKSDSSLGLGISSVDDVFFFFSAPVDSIRCPLAGATVPVTYMARGRSLGSSNIEYLTLDGNHGNGKKDIAKG